MRSTFSEVNTIFNNTAGPKQFSSFKGMQSPLRTKLQTVFGQAKPTKYYPNKQETVKDF